MTIEEVEIASVSPDPANVRTHSERNLEAIKASLRRFGQQKPIVVDGSGIVRAGNGTLAAAIALGWERIKVVRTNLTGSEATAYGIADNRTGDESIGSTFDQQSLAEVLAALSAEDAELAASTGYTPDEIAGLLTAQAVASQPPAEAPADFPAVDETLQTDHQCPKCGYRWSGSTAPQQEAA
jgi:ParB-like chromosome segregation protein Spo0J